MTFQITYYSPEGYIQKIAEALHTLLPPDTPMGLLQKEAVPAAQIQLVGFELKMLDLHELPLNICHYLKALEGKTVFLFATVPFQPDDVLTSRIHKCVAAALPAECDYRGLFLCPAQAPVALTDGFQSVVQRHPSNTRAKHWLERCRKAAGHPNAQDTDACCRFANHVLKL